MARPKRQHPMLPRIQAYLKQNAPDLTLSPIHVRMLDGPPGSPRYAAIIERCCAQGECPYGVTPATAAAGKCPIHLCELRHSLRLLLDRQGGVVQTADGGVHWV